MKKRPRQTTEEKKHEAAKAARIAEEEAAWAHLRAGRWSRAQVLAHLRTLKNAPSAG